MSTESTSHDVSTFMNLHTGDTLKEISGRPLPEIGAQFSLLLHSWINGGSLPSDPERLRRFSGADREEWPAIWTALSPLWARSEDGLTVHHPRTLEQIARARTAKAQAIARGRAGGSAPHPTQRGDGVETKSRPSRDGAEATREMAPRRGRDGGRDGAEPPNSELLTPRMNAEHRTPDTRSGVGAEASADGRSPPAPAEVSLLDFATRGKTRTWSLTQPEVDGLHEAFPDLDIVAEAKKAKAWIATHPSKTKTAKGMPAFLYRWISNEQDGPRTSRPGNGGRPARDPRVGGTHAEDYTHPEKPGPIDMDAVLRGGQA